MSVIQIGLVDTTRHLDSELVHNAAMALNLQVTRDLPQFWPVNATVTYLPSPHKIPAGIWPVRLVKTLARHGYMASAKAVMIMLGVPVGPPRQPHAQLTRNDVAELKQELFSLGFFDWI